MNFYNLIFCIWITFVCDLASLLKKVPIILKKCYILKNFWAFYRKIGPFFNREILFWLWGLRPRPKLPRPWAGPVSFNALYDTILWNCFLTDMKWWKLHKAIRFKNPAREFNYLLFKVGFPTFFPNSMINAIWCWPIYTKI